jgi:cysteine desulfurase / selenocysteine lyase
MSEVLSQSQHQLNVDLIRQQFPILHQLCHGHPLVYLDTGASALKPQSVIDKVKHFYEHDYANIHRGVYELSERATAAYEGVRDQVATFINAKSREEIIFTKGTTDAINLVANSFGGLTIKAGDEILLSAMEHHSNIVPWQMLCEHTGAKIKVIPLKDDSTLDMDAYKKLLTSKTKMVALIHVSNVLGTINPIKEMTVLAHEKNIPVLVDGAQAAPRMQIDMQDVDCDFYTFSSHKMYGPTGVGVLYAKRDLLEKMPPYQGGGDMISQVTFEKTQYNVLPYKFEAGTPNITGVVGFGAALTFINTAGLTSILDHELQLTHYAMEKLSAVPDINIYGHAKDKIGVISFTMDEIHPHDIGTILDNEGVAVRAGHHCAMPLMEHFGVPAMVRASLGAYNNKNDIDALVNALNKVREIFGV